MPTQTIQRAFSETIRELRKERQWTQEETAFHTGVSYGFIQELEKAHKQPSLVTIIKLAKGFNVTPDKLVMPVWDAVSIEN